MLNIHLENEWIKKTRLQWCFSYNYVMEELYVEVDSYPAYNLTHLIGFRND